MKGLNKLLRSPETTDIRKQARALPSYEFTSQRGKSLSVPFSLPADVLNCACWNPASSSLELLSLCLHISFSHSQRQLTDGCCKCQITKLHPVELQKVKQPVIWLPVNFATFQNSFFLSEELDCASLYFLV